MLRNSIGAVVAGWSNWIFGSYCFRIAEAFCLKEVLNWLKSRQQLGLLVEMDSKAVLDALHNRHKDLSPFGCIITDCLAMLSHVSNVSIHFIPRQANEVANALAKASYLHASSFYWHKALAFVRVLVQTDVDLFG